MNAGWLVPLHAEDQILDGAEFGRCVAAVIGQRAGDPVTLGFVAQAASLRSGNIGHQVEGLGRLPQHSAGSDLLIRAAHEIHSRFANEKGGAVEEKLPR